MRVNDAKKIVRVYSGGLDPGRARGDDAERDGEVGGVRDVRIARC